MCFLTAVVLCQVGSPLCLALAVPYTIIKQYAVMTKAAMTKTFRTQEFACPHMTAAPRCLRPTNLANHYLVLLAELPGELGCQSY